MNLYDAAAAAVTGCALFTAVRYMYKSRKKGVKCIGCPFASSCTSCSGEKRGHH